jgi:hypothetical protein
VTVDVMRVVWGPPIKETSSAHDHSLYLSLARLILPQKPSSTTEKWTAKIPLSGTKPAATGNQAINNDDGIGGEGAGPIALRVEAPGSPEDATKKTLKEEEAWCHGKGICGCLMDVSRCHGKYVIFYSTQK